MLTGAPKIALITVFDEGFREIADRSLPSMRRYADRFGLRFFEFSAEAEGRPPSWAKIPRIRAILQSGFDYCLYVDADTMFVRFDEDIRDHIDGSSDLHLCWHNESNSEVYAPLSGHFNCGVMAWRTSDWSLKFLDDIWRKEELTDHIWWEQATLHSLLGYRSVLDPELSDAQVAEHCSRVGRLPVNWNTVVGHTIAPDPVIVHFAGIPRPLRLAVMDREIAARGMREALPPHERHLLSRFMNLMLYQAMQHHSQSPAVFLADRLLSLRHRLAPPGSRRESWIRAIYVPLIRGMV